MRVGIIGWYGYGNLGDEILLEVMITEVSKFVKKDNIVVFSERPACVEKVHNIKSIIIGYEGKLGEFIDALEKVDIVIWGGGGSFSDWQKEALPNIFKIISIAKALDKKVFLYSVGCGPINTDNGKRVMQEICKLSDFVTVRDQGTFGLLRDIGCCDVSLTSDPAVIYENSMILKPLLKKDTRIINLGICVSYLFNNEELWPGQYEKFLVYKNSMVELIGKVTDKYPRIKISFIPVFPKDEDFAKELMKDLNLKNAVLRPNVKYDETLSNLAKMDVIISTRLHAIILSSLFGIPSIGLIMHSKIFYYLHQIGLSDFGVDLGDGLQWSKFDFNIEKILHDFDYILNNNVEIEKVIKNGVKKMVAKQVVNRKILQNLLSN